VKEKYFCGRQVIRTKRRISLSAEPGSIYRISPKARVERHAGEILEKL
jgi:hypothetical protein